METRAVMAIGCLTALAAFASAPVAAAHPDNADSAQNVIDRLESLGYTVGLNRTKIDPLRNCTVIGMHPSDPGTTPATVFTTVWIDLSCAPNNSSDTPASG